MVNIGFIGLGIMGKPKVEHLIKGRHRFLYSHRGGVCRLGYYAEDRDFLTEGVAQYAYNGGC